MKKDLKQQAVEAICKMKIPKDLKKEQKYIKEDMERIQDIIFYNGVEQGKAEQKQAILELMEKVPQRHKGYAVSKIIQIDIGEYDKFVSISYIKAQLKKEAEEK